MAEPFLGEIRLFSFNFPPKGWALCNGQLLSISQNSALFSLLGTMYGGNGQTTFALPNLQGRTPIHRGGNFTQGEAGGESWHTLTASEMPAHTHAANASSNPGSTPDPSNALWAQVALPAYSGQSDAAMASQAVGSTGGSQPHENTPPFLALNYCIALTGIFPSHS